VYFVFMFPFIGFAMQLTLSTNEFSCISLEIPASLLPLVELIAPCNNVILGCVTGTSPGIGRND